MIITDDASTDDTQALLSQINDSRFRYSRNSKNLGAHKNWLHSLELGRGEWLYLVMGRDMMCGENVSRLIELLERASKNGVVFIKDHGHYKDDLSIHSGIDAMSRFIGYNHPTGEIFRREEFTAIPEREHYYSISDMYPDNYVIRDLLLTGKGAFIHSGAGLGGFATDKAKVKSQVEYAVDIYKAYFAPARKLKQFYEQIDMIDELPAGTFTKQELDGFFREKYYTMLEHVSYWFRMWCRDPVQMAHYGQPVRYIDIPEMTRNILKAHHDTKAHLVEAGRYSSSRKMIMLWSTVKAVVHISSKSLIRSIIEPLGIWKILHYFRNY